MATKKMASAAKKSAKIVSMATAMAVASFGLSGDDVRAAQAAFADMAEDMGPGAIIVSMNPFDGIIA